MTLRCAILLLACTACHLDVRKDSDHTRAVDLEIDAGTSSASSSTLDVQRWSTIAGGGIDQTVTVEEYVREDVAQADSEHLIPNRVAGGSSPPVLANTEGSSSGRTPAFEAGHGGSSPSLPAILLRRTITTTHITPPTVTSGESAHAHEQSASTSTLEVQAHEREHDAGHAATDVSAGPDWWEWVLIGAGVVVVVALGWKLRRI